MPTLEEAMAMARLMHSEGFIYSEAYPVVRWRNNGWVETNDKQLFKLLDTAMLLMRLSDLYMMKG